MNCMVNNTTVAQICANTADGDIVNDPAPCVNGYYNIGKGNNLYQCTQQYLVNNVDNAYPGAPSQKDVKNLDPSCFSCSSKQNYNQSVSKLPNSYLNLNKTWDIQKPFQL